MENRVFKIYSFNTNKWRYDIVDVREEVYREYSRHDSRIRYRDKKFWRHEMPFSYLKTPEDQTFDSFKEFADYSEAPENRIVADETIQELYNAISYLEKEDVEFIKRIYVDGCSVRKYALEKGVHPSTMFRRKKKILSKLKTLIPH